MAGANLGEVLVPAVQGQPLSEGKPSEDRAVRPRRLAAALLLRRRADTVAAEPGRLRRAQRAVDEAAGLQRRARSGVGRAAERSAVPAAPAGGVEEVRVAAPPREWRPRPGHSSLALVVRVAARAHALRSPIARARQPKEGEKVYMTSCKKSEESQSDKWIVY